MIRKNVLFCKLFRIKNSSKYLFDSFMASFRPELQTCPSCGSSGNCRIHAYYGRRLTDLVHNTPTASSITVLRLVCSSCGHTHAVLPDLIIPYLSYSLLFILRVLAEAFLCRSSLEHLCERFHITQNQFYHWKHLWDQHKREWLGILEDSEISSAAFLARITVRTAYSSFSRAFTAKTSVSFLQSHRDPCRSS